MNGQSMLVMTLSADNLCKQFGPRSGPTKCLDPKHDTLIMFLEDFLKKLIFEKSQQTTSKV